MADPQHTPELDDFDRMTVSLYRAGLAGATLGTAWLAIRSGRHLDPRLPALLVMASVAVCAVDLHLYDKRIRWLIQAVAAAGPVVGALAVLRPSPTLWALGLGLSLVGLSALAMKEGFCFRVPGVRAVPLLLAIGVVALWVQRTFVAAGAFGVAAVILAGVVVAKLQMPLTHDVGDRSRYQV